VGRGAARSQCWLLTQPIDESDKSGVSPRVAAVVGTTDGFELAEIDLQLRGEGTLMSSAQKGRNDLRLASLRTDAELITVAREIAFEIIGDDPDLAHHPELLDELALLFTDDAEEFLTRS
jgi:ATP-dependent DNA helicase RecG